MPYFVPFLSLRGTYKRPYHETYHANMHKKAVTRYFATLNTAMLGISPAADIQQIIVS